MGRSPPHPEPPQLPPREVSRRCDCRCAAHAALGICQSSSALPQPPSSPPPLPPASTISWQLALAEPVLGPEPREAAGPRGWGGQGWEWGSLFALHPFDLALVLPSLPAPLRAADSRGLFAWPGQDQGHECESQPEVPGRVHLQPVPSLRERSLLSARTEKSLWSLCLIPLHPSFPLFTPASAEPWLKHLSVKVWRCINSLPPSISECQAVKGKGAVGEEGETNFAIRSHTG